MCTKIREIAWGKKIRELAHCGDSVVLHSSRRDPPTRCLAKKWERMNRMKNKLVYFYLVIKSVWKIAWKYCFFFFLFFFFLFFFINCLFWFYNIHTFIQSQYIHPSPFAEAFLHILVACVLSGEIFPVVPRRESNSGLPYSKPTRCQLGHAAPWKYCFKGP